MKESAKNAVNNFERNTWRKACRGMIRKRLHSGDSLPWNRLYERSNTATVVLHRPQFLHQLKVLSSVATTRTSVCETQVWIRPISLAPRFSEVTRTTAEPATVSTVFS